jgi:hypothetical protein
MPASQLLQHGEEPRHGCGLARARAARDDAEPPVRRHRGRESLPIRSACWEQPLHCASQRFRINVWRLRAQRSIDVLSDDALLTPEPVEVQQTVSKPNGPAGIHIYAHIDEPARPAADSSIMRR